MIEWQKISESGLCSVGFKFLKAQTLLSRIYSWSIDIIDALLRDRDRTA